MIRKTSFILLLLLPFATFAQSGWTRAKKSAFLKADLAYFTATKYYSPLGNQLTTNRFSQFNLSFYGEYGLYDRLTLIGSGPLLRVHAYETTSPVIGQGDLKLNLKYRFTSNKLPVSISFGPDIPTGRANAFANDKELPGVQINLPTGDGEFNFWTTLAASKSFGKMYATLFAAYDLRTSFEKQAFRDLYQFGGELGYHPVEKLWLNTKAKVQLSNGKSQFPSLSFIRGDASTFTMVSAEAFYKVKSNFGLSATLIRPVKWPVAFHNVYSAPVFSVGLIFEK